MESLKKKNVIYNKGNPLISFFRRLNIFFTKRLSRDTLDILVRIKTGNHISAPIKDLLYKDRKGIFRTIKTKIEINDEIPTEWLTTSVNGDPVAEIIFHNGEGNHDLIKLCSESMIFKHMDVRLNDQFEAIANKVLMLFSLEKEKKLFMITMSVGLISLGLFIMFGLTGLGNVIKMGLEAILSQATEPITQALSSAP